MVDAQVHELVVAREVALGCQLHAYEQPDLLLDRLHERLDLFQTANLKPAVEMYERDARFLLRRPAGLDDVAQLLDGRLGLTPTFCPVVENRQFNRGEALQKAHTGFT